MKKIILQGITLIFLNIPLVGQGVFADPLPNEEDGTSYLLPSTVPNPMSTWIPPDYKGVVVDPIKGKAPESWQAVVDKGLPAYYIDSSHSAATDKDNPYGSPDKPRLTIRETTYQEGSYVEIHGGPYNGGGQIIFKANGTPENPVWFRGGDKINKAIITGEMIPKGKYLFIENLKFEDRKPLSLRTHDKSSLSNVVIRDLSFTGDGDGSGSGSAIPIYSTSSSNRFHDILVYGNDISYLGNDYDDIDTGSAGSKENDYHGIHPDINVDRVWVFKNNVHHLGGDSIQVSRASTSDASRPKNVYIVNNLFHSNLENAIDIKTAENTLILGNTVYDWREHKGNPSTGVAIVVHNKAKNTWIVNNNISKASNAIIISDGSANTWVVGNLIYDIKHSSWDDSWNPESIYSGGSAIHYRGGSSGGIINNTLIDTDKGIESAGAGLTIKNNIISKQNHDDLDNVYDIYIGTSSTDTKISNNLIYNTTSGSSYIPRFKNADCSSCLYTSPNFSASSIYDVSFKTQESSPALGRGGNVDDILTTKYINTFANDEIEITGLNKDIFGNSRVSHGRIDIGAYESLDEGSTATSIKKPIAPSKPSIVIPVL